MQLRPNLHVFSKLHTNFHWKLNKFYQKPNKFAQKLKKIAKKLKENAQKLNSPVFLNTFNNGKTAQKRPVLTPFCLN